MGRQNIAAPLLYVGVGRVTSAPNPDPTSMAVIQYTPESKNEWISTKN